MSNNDFEKIVFKAKYSVCEFHEVYWVQTAKIAQYHLKDLLKKVLSEIKAVLKNHSPISI